MADQQQWVAPGAGNGATQPAPEGAPTAPEGGPSAAVEGWAPPHGPGSSPSGPGGWGAAPPIAPAPPRPGIIPLRPLTLGDIYGGVGKAVRGNPGATIGLAFLVTLAAVLPLSLLSAFLVAQADDFATGNLGEGPDAAATLESLASILPALASAPVSFLLVSFVAHVVGHGVVGRKVGAADTFATVIRRTPSLLMVVGVNLLVGLVALALLAAGPVALFQWDRTAAIWMGVLAALVYLVLMLVLSVKWGFALSVVVLEQAKGVAALRRSWQLTRRAFWRILGISLLTSLIVGFAAQVLTFPISVVGMALTFPALEGGDPTDVAMTQTVVNAVAALVTAAVTTPFTAGVSALLYIDQRIRREGLDVALITRTEQAATRGL